MENTFRNTSYRNELSKVVKSIVRWAVDALKKFGKENGKVFFCNDVAKITSEICGISRRQNFNIKGPAPALK